MSVVTVLLMVFTLVGVLPALPLGAVEGTITVDKTYYSLDSSFSTVTATVTDGDLNVVRQTKSRITDNTAATTFTIKNGTIEGHITVTDEDLSSQADGTLTTFVLGKTTSCTANCVKIGDRGTTTAQPTSNTAPAGVITPDGVIDKGDVVVKVGGSILTLASITSVSETAGTVTLAAAPLAGVAVSVTYAKYEYDKTTTANTPLAAPPVVMVGTTTHGVTSFDSAAGTVTVGTSITNPTITFMFNKVDTLSKGVKFTSTSSSTGIEATLTETGAGTGIFTGSVMVTNDPSIVADLFVQDGDTITATYVDASPAVTKTATAKFDKSAPTVTIVDPAHDSFTTNTAPTFVMDITDAGAGIDTTTLLLSVAGSNVTPTLSPIVNGYRVQFWNSAGFAEGSVSWFITVKDKVNNAPASTVRGASAGKAAKVTIDTSAPDLIQAQTGIAATYDATNAYWKDSITASKKSVRLEYKVGVNPATSAPLDETTLATTDYLVDGVAPTAVTLGVGDSSVGTVKRFVYLTLATDLATSAKPVIQQTGAVADKAGNSLASDSVTSLDKIKPEVTVTASPGIISTITTPTDYSKATITVTSSETLSSLPTVTVGGNAVTMAGATPTSWTGTYTVVGASGKLDISVTGTDTSGNAITDPSTLSDTTKHTYVQQDLLAPTVKFSPDGSADVPTANPWISVTFCDGTSAGGCGGVEYTGDSYLKVTLTAATLDGVDVMSQLFSSDSIQYTLAASGLALGNHTVKVSGVDLAGNIVTDSSVTFKVIAKPTINIAVKPGWNLISVPASLIDPAINTVLAGLTTIDKIYSYDAVSGWTFATKDATTGNWTGTLTTIVDGKGYWVSSKAFDTIKVATSERTDPTAPLPSYTVKKGWNLVGFTTLANAATQSAISYLAGVKWTSLYAFDPDPAVLYTLVKPNAAGTDTVPGAYNVANGKGYWVYLTEDGLLVP